MDFLLYEKNAIPQADTAIHEINRPCWFSFFLLSFQFMGPCFLCYYTA